MQTACFLSIIYHCLVCLQSVSRGREVCIFFFSLSVSACTCMLSVESLVFPLDRGSNKSFILSESTILSTIYLLEVVIGCCA